ncbi:MAG: ZIP family metal transporter [Candidatus Cyclonatronum sp.]|uniref:ZIP family metal transporter n=1 Tax=Cyclonatronum sp. TaxID=3024185 RepID=UPI0025C6526C|nr:ZIP family metal transporter [Cyclonatronum sp.]MCH8485824.1 ZIP family metal transporter [Cyclonatronum sp.]
MNSNSGSSENRNQNAYSNNLLLDGLAGLLLVGLVIWASVWLGRQTGTGSITTWFVFVAAGITALTTGFGALPFLFTRSISRSWLGYGNALAAGLMLGASLGLLIEGATIADVSNPFWRTLAGALTGAVLVVLAHKLLKGREDDLSVGNIQGANAVKILLIVGIMTAHSFAEGIGVGVSYGETEAFGVFITIAIAIHNIPEGLAISLVLLPRGSSIRAAAVWSIFSSLPQPLMAVPAFWFVLTFKPFLPFGLGLAAGAMLWMVARELLPEALAEVPARIVYLLTGLTGLAMMAFQFWLH